MLLCACFLQAAVFTSTDGVFTIHLPSGWTIAKKPAVGSVLSVVKNNARIDIKSVPDCHQESCLEQKVQSDLLQVKNKKMQVVGNTFTGEDIKRINFSTGEPFFYISFFTPKNDFSSGYFLINQQAYSILAKDLTYAQTDLIFSFISPVTEENPLPNENASGSALSVEVDLADKRTYDIEPTPAVLEEVIVMPETADETPAPARPQKITFPTTFVTRTMPPYVRQLGHGFDVIVLLLLAFILLLLISWGVHFFVKPHRDTTPVNPNSPYPIKFRRLYGTPALFFRARDNQGNVLQSVSSRWDSLFLCGGFFLMVAAVLVMAFTGLVEQTQLVRLTAFAYNTIYSMVALIIPLGFVILICGVLWAQLVMRQFVLYDKKANKAVYVMQRGFGLTKECYLAYFAKSKEMLLLERKRFTLLRKWQLLDKQRNVLAHITEDSLPRALVRKFTGHLWGMLRASYRIEGHMESTGTISSERTPFNRFTCQIDKPQALAARDLLVTSLVINIRDRDRWYPWF